MTEPNPARRGQALVIAALVMLFVFVAVMLTFAIGHRTREKIKLQAIADSGAYSLAVAGARTFNFFAWSNRAHVAHDISILSIHSHQSYLSWYDELLRAQGSAHYIAGGVLAAYCVPCAVSGVCCQSCTNSWRAFRVGRLYRNTIHGEFHRKYFDSQTYDRVLSAGTSGHLGLIQTIGAAQRLMKLDLTMKSMSQTLAGDAARTIDREVGPSGMAGLRNVSNFDAAVGWQPEIAEDWLEITAGSRWPRWLTRRGFVYASGHWWQSYSRATQQAGPCMIVPIPPTNSGNSKILGRDVGSHSALKRAVDKKSPHGLAAWTGFSGGAGHGFGAWDQGTAFSLWICDCPGFGASGAKGGLYSDADGAGMHLVHGRKRSEGQLHKAGGCGGGRSCDIYQGHMRYKMATERSKGGNTGNAYLWDQPHTVAFVTKQMNRRPEVWDFDFTATLPLPVRFTTTRSQGDAGPMGAIAGGLVYYHKPNGSGSDGWKEPPSVWNPYWRAKLHPLRPSDARMALMGHASGMPFMLLGDKALNY